MAYIWGIVYTFVNPPQMSYLLHCHNENFLASEKLLCLKSLCQFFSIVSSLSGLWEPTALLWHVPYSLRTKATKPE